MVPLAPPDMTSHDTKLKCKNGFTRSGFFSTRLKISISDQFFFRLKNPNWFHDFSCCGRKTDGNPVWGSPALIRMRRRWKGELAPSTFFLLRKIFPTGVSNYLQLLIGRHRLSVSDTQHWHPRDWSWDPLQLSNAWQQWMKGLAWSFQGWRSNDAD